jgi:hypothetical protein
MPLPDHEPFVAPFNWCDGRCERCPLSRECPLNRRIEQRRWVHTARGKDPDDMKVVLADMATDLAQILSNLRDAAEEEGVDLDAPMPALPTSLDSVRLQRAATTLITTLDSGIRPPEQPAPEVTAVVKEAMAISLNLRMKSARIGGQLADERDESWAMDIVPNLLLVERQRARLDEVLAELGGLLEEDASATIRGALATMDRVLRPLIEGVDAEARAKLEEMIAAGAAPSPFCVVES